MKSIENKYYTPSIEEFRVGFEYEQLLPTVVYDPKLRYKIKRTIFNKKVWTSIGVNYNWEQDLEENKIRVKYLDGSDIEELGFSLKSTTGSYQFHYSLTINEYALVNITHIPSSSIIRITKEDINIFEEHENYLFNGAIKNKSELKVLLKQLNIK